MKKSFFTSIIILFTSGIVFCQTAIEKGTISLNGNISFVSNYEESSANNTTIFIFNPSFDYFLFDNFSLGLMANFQNKSFLGKNNTQWGIGPAVRYYFNVDKIKPFLGVGYSYAAENSNISNDDIKSSSVIFNLGADYFVTKNVAFETIFSYSFINSKYPQDYADYYSNLNVTRKSLSIGLGINFFFNN